MDRTQHRQHILAAWCARSSPVRSPHEGTQDSAETSSPRPHPKANPTASPTNWVDAWATFFDHHLTPARCVLCLETLLKEGLLTTVEVRQLESAVLRCCNARSQWRNLRGKD